MAVVHEKDEVNAMLKESEIKDAATCVSGDAESEEAVRQQLARSGHCGLRTLQVRVDREGILLAGEVSTYFLKQTAQEIARIVCPDHQIRNTIVVSDPKPDTFIAT